MRAEIQDHRASRGARSFGRLRAVLTATAAAAALTSCASAGPYGFSRNYSPLAAEEAALSGSDKYDPVMARRLPQDWRKKTVHFFGVVLAREEGEDGRADLTVSVRRLAARNLCESGSDDSCRVTVSEREHSRIHASVPLSQQDAMGKQRVQPRSLLRIVGRIEDKPDPKDGSHVVQASYYRHWPPGYYVTDQARSYMRR